MDSSQARIDEGQSGRFWVDDSILLHSCSLHSESSVILVCNLRPEATLYFGQSRCATSGGGKRGIPLSVLRISPSLLEALAAFLLHASIFSASYFRATVCPIAPHDIFDPNNTEPVYQRFRHEDKGRISIEQPARGHPSICCFRLTSLSLASSRCETTLFSLANWEECRCVR